MQKAIELAKYPSIKAIKAEDEVPDTSMLYIAELAEEYLKKFANKQETDKYLDYLIKMVSCTLVILLLK